MIRGVMDGLSGGLGQDLVRNATSHNGTFAKLPSRGLFVNPLT